MSGLFQRLLGNARTARSGAAPSRHNLGRHLSGANATRRQRYATSPLLASKTPPWRSKFLVAALGAGFLVLGGRAAYVQVIGTDFFLAEGDKRYARKLELPSNRGRILDRGGELLASSIEQTTIWVRPREFKADADQRRQFAKLLDMSPAEFERRLADNPNFVYLRRQIDDDTAQRVRALALKGVGHEPEFKRVYPNGEATAHVVGFSDVQDRGQEGIERAFDDTLAGRDGQRRVITDRLGRVVEDIGERVPAIDGRDVQLALDTKIQYHAYRRIAEAVREHKAKAGSVVVLDVRTGEVLALANVPTYTPADRRRLSGAQLRNRALTDTFEPGSTMKPFIAAMALESGRVKPQTVINTAPRSIVISGWSPSDVHPHGDLTVEKVIQKSSNVGIVKIAMQMPAREMFDTYSAIGLGHKPELDFPGVVTGRLRPYKSWKPVEQATMSFGYGLSASLFQLARAYTVFAHDGELIPSTMLKRAPDAPAPAAERVFSPATAAEIRHMLKLAAGPGGTAPKAQTVGYSVGGKSGTAHKQEGKGYADKKYRSWFVGFAPVDKPRIVVAVMVDEPGAGKYYGGEVAAPVFSDVVQKSLQAMGVPNDLEVRPQIVTGTDDAVDESF